MEKIITLTTKDIEQFADESYELLKKNLGEQFQKHFNLLVDEVPSIKSCEWTSSQEDEMVFELVYFKIFKNNGYIFEYTSYTSGKQETLSSNEFNIKEIELINNFQSYLGTLAKLSVALFGSESFRVDAEPTKELSNLSSKLRI